MIPHPPCIRHRKPHAAVGIRHAQLIEGGRLVCVHVLCGVQRGVKVNRLAYLRPVLPVPSVPGELREAHPVRPHLEGPLRRASVYAGRAEHIPFRPVFAAFVRLVYHRHLMRYIDYYLIRTRLGVSLGQAPVPIVPYQLLKGHIYGRRVFRKWYGLRRRFRRRFRCWRGSRLWRGRSGHGGRGHFKYGLSCLRIGAARSQQYYEKHHGGCSFHFFAFLLIGHGVWL